MPETELGPMNAAQRFNAFNEPDSFMKGPLDSRQLQAFAILARTGSFTQTAREMFLTQSAVSHSMKALESDAGCRLLDRVGKKVMLTQAGEHLLKHAEIILREMQAAREGIEQLGKWGRGRLRVGATATICTALLPAVLREFKESFPRSLIQVEPGDSRELVGGLERQRIDLGLMLQEAADDRFECLPIFSDELVFITAPLHPWAQEGTAPRAEIARQNLIVYRRASQTFRVVDEYFRSEDIVLNTVIELGSMEAIKELVKLGLGVSIAAPWVVQRELEDGSLRAIPLGRRKLKRFWSVAHWKGRRLTLAEETFVGLCRSAVETLPRTMDLVATNGFAHEDIPTRLAGVP
ncbi:MAG TPA: LysR family transcriptional regulator [Verrucomicrobiales bacterium]|nr:LysR family transcriptional regulator [Verrucomicrobiales bacterium]